MSFHVGQRVVCVDAERTDALGFPELVEGAIYTIRWIGMYSNPANPRARDEALCVRVHEVFRGPDEWFPEDPLANDTPFLARRFRPIQERSTETGMAILRSLLNPSNEKVRA